MKNILSVLLFVSTLNLFGQSLPPFKIDISEPFLVIKQANNLIDQGNEDLKNHVSVRKRLRNHILVSAVLVGTTYLLFKQGTDDSEALGGGLAAASALYFVYFALDGPYRYPKQIAQKKFSEADLLYRGIKKQ